MGALDVKLARIEARKSIRNEKFKKRKHKQEAEANENARQANIESSPNYSTSSD